ncbi:transcriptional regulator [Streptomyces mashuensis]|uniref:Transcriptional regulator n=1 Tax=Streptomyces mashuensis TaxID=33904 RepID=A0A919ECI8_9ACTN|nr:helix-turn-helix transcriptional regulator [Streptomyces mashuensis]GHF40888.1 transcriptional regulator [Streptomyces mashuensis]
MADEPKSGAALLGDEVRAWRKGKGLSQRELGDAAHYGQQYVAKVEAGERLASETFVTACDAVFGTPGSFARLRRRIVQGAFSDWFEPFVKLEKRATTIYDYSVGFIWGLLQTESYAEAIFRKAHPCDDPDVTAAKVAKRLERREVLRAENPPLLWSVMDESCLRRRVGSARVMAEQLAHLLEVCSPPSTVTLQILPFASGTPAWYIPFTLMRFGPDEDDVLYQEDMGVGQLVDSADMLADARTFFDRLRADALSPEASLTMIREVMEEWKA